MNGNHDHDAAVRLLRPLDTELTSVSTVDVVGAMRVGGRRRRARRAATVVVAMAATALVLAGVTLAVGRERAAPPGSPPSPQASRTAAPSAPTTCAVSKLTVPAGTTMSLLSAGDPSGRYFVGHYQGPGYRRIVIWDGDRPVDVSVDGTAGEPTDVNRAGAAVGLVWAGGPKWATYPYLYRDGMLTRLAQQGVANAINDAGVIVGHDGDGVTGGTGNAVVWRTPSGPAERLPVPPDAINSEARGIDDSGTIVGAVWLSRSRYVPYVWLPDGRHRALPMPPGVPEGESVLATAVRGDFVLGALDRGALSVVRWNLRTGEVKVYDDLMNVRSGLNRHGWLVTADDRKRGVLVSDPHRLTLSSPAGERFSTANVISEDGRTIGGSVDHGVGTWAVVWRCS